MIYWQLFLSFLQIGALFPRQAEISDEHQRGIVQHQQQEEDLLDEKDGHLHVHGGKHPHHQKRDHAADGAGHEHSQEQSPLLARVQLVGTGQSVHKAIARDQQAGQPKQEDGGEIRDEGEHGKVQQHRRNRTRRPAEHQRGAVDQPGRDQRPKLVHGEKEDPHDECGEKICVEPAPDALERADPDAHVLFEKAEEERQADRQQNQADHGKDPALRIDEGEKGKYL